MNAAQTWQAHGKLGIHAFKRPCRKKFMLCDLESPRVLEPSEELPFVPVNGSIKLEPYGGTCGMLRFQYKNKTVTGLELAEMSCASQLVPHICEVK